MNKVILTGRMTKDADLRQTAQGKSVCTFSIAVDRNNAKKEVDFITVVVWDKQAEFVNKYLGKGRKIVVEGQLRTRNYQDKETQKTVYVTEVWSSSIEFADSKPQETTVYEDSGDYEGTFNG